MTRTTKVFQNGRSQAIRIPKDFRVDTREVYIEKMGDTLLIRPKPKSKWEDFFALLDQTDTSNFLSDRLQPPLDRREFF